MEGLDHIAHTARMEAKGFRSASDEAGVNDMLPYFCIKRASDAVQYTGRSKYLVTGHNATGHDNEPRMEFVCEFLRSSVLPYVESGVDVSGFYNIELHDSYSYLPNHADYRNCLTFSRKRDDTHMTLLPNPYQMTNYAGGQFNDTTADKVPWEKKRDVLFFAGSTTGSRDPLQNARVKACAWSLLHQDAALFRITSVVQMTDREFVEKVPNASQLRAQPFPQQENYNYKFLVNIAGNTCAWSRVPMIMASKSLMMHVYHSDIEWYYPMMIEGTHFMGCGMHTILSKRAFAMSNPQLVQFIVANANRFCTSFLGRNQAALYTVQLLESIGAASSR